MILARRSWSSSAALHHDESMTIDQQLVLLFVLPIPIASIAWTVTHEEVFREPREWCLYDDWRGYLIGGFSLVWLANVYMSFFGRLRLEIKENRLEIAAAESREDAERPKKSA